MKKLPLLLNLLLVTNAWAEEKATRLQKMFDDLQDRIIKENREAIEKLDRGK